MHCNPVPCLNCCRLSKIWINIMMFLAFQTTNCIAPCISTTDRLVKEQFLCLAVCGIYSPPNYHNNYYYYLIIVNQAWISYSRLFTTWRKVGLNWCLVNLEPICEEFILTQGNNLIAMRNNLWEKITENVCE